MQQSEILGRVEAVGAAVQAAAVTGGKLPVWTVEIQFPIYQVNTLEVEATDAAAACEAAIELGNMESGGWRSCDHPGETFVSALCQGSGDPWNDCRSAVPVPVTYAEHGTQGRDCLPAAARHAAIYEALAAYAKAKGLQRFGATFGEFRDSMVEFMGDLRSVLADCGLPLHDVLTASGPDGVSPFVVVTEQGIARLESAHPDMDGLTYPAVDLDFDGATAEDLHLIDAGGAKPVRAWLSFNDAHHTAMNALQLETAPSVATVQAAE